MNQTQSAILELIQKYDKARKEFIAEFGDDFNEEDFRAWFTSQVEG